MPRPKKCRLICQRPQYLKFFPEGGQNAPVYLFLEEYEAIRLIDLQKATHLEASKQMGISRTTMTEIYERARTKTAKALIQGRALIIEEGQSCSICFENMECHKECTYGAIGDNTMKIAVTYDNKNVYGHFGHTKAFKVYDIKDNKIQSSMILDSGDSAHEALASLLSEGKIDALICGGLGMGARMALNQMGITVYPGVEGDADEAVKALLEGKLNYDPNATCHHHDNDPDHSCSGGHCHH